MVSREAGLELREDIDTVLEPGMVISMEPMLTIAEGKPGAGGYREHDILVITEDGNENITGYPMRVGDLLRSGTISGPEKVNRGSLLELSWAGKEPLTLDTGETRTFLVDGDTLTLRGAAKGDGYRIGFGECVGTLRSAPDLDKTKNSCSPRSLGCTIECNLGSGPLGVKRHGDVCSQSRVVLDQGDVGLEDFSG